MQSVLGQGRPQQNNQSQLLAKPHCSGEFMISQGGEGGTGSTVINQEIGLFLMGWAKGGRRHLSDPKGRGRRQPNIRSYFEENCRKMKKIETGEASKICLCKSTAYNIYQFENVCM